MKKILVTGGAGFIGSHLCERLLSEDNLVICMDNLYTGSKNNIKKFLEHPSFEYIEHDLCDPFNLKVDQIYNMACPASPIHYQKDAIQTTKTSIYGAINVLEVSRQYNSRVLQASTSEVYGDPILHPQKENYWGNVNPIGIRSCYDEGKRVAESLFFDYHRKYNIDIKIARIFNTYGPNMDPNDGRVVSNFITQALLGNDITIYGSGTQTRSFCFVSDLIEGLVILMNSEQEITGPINLGNPVEFTMIELAELILKLTASKSKLIFKPLPADDPKQRQPDITLAENTFNWKPKICLEDGIQITINFFRNLLSHS